MNVGLYATKLQALVMKEREEIEAAYERYPDPTLFWAFVDLVGSSNYRIVHGLKSGYVRGETFFSLIGAVVSRSADLRIVKEIGDAVLLACSTFRPLFEGVVLVDQISRQMADLAGTKNFPFAVRAGLGFGPAKRLTRRHEDFLGTPIDQLSRIMGIRSEKTNLLVDEDAYGPSKDILQEYQPTITVGEPHQVPAAKSKDMLRSVYYREIIVDHAALPEFRNHFSYWK